MSQELTTTNQTPELTDLDIEDIQSGLKTGAFTSTELVESFQDRIDKLEPTYNAFTSLNPDALARAKELDREYQESGPRSPLHGVPIVVKDTIDVAGLPTTAGYEGFVSSAGGVDLTPETNAPIIDKLEDAGAIVLGKTNLPALSSGNGNANTSYFGPTYNGYDPTLAPGASSTGSATAVAADLGVVGIGADTGGSIISPAAAQSLVGIKPTFGLVSGEGSIGAPSTTTVSGPLSNNVYDAAATLDVIAEGKYSSDSYVSALDDQALEGKRIGLFGSGFKDVELTPETQSLYDRATQSLVEQGATVVKDPFAGSGFTDLPFDSGNALKQKTSIYDLDQYLKRPGSSTNVNSVEELIEQGAIDEETLESYKSTPGGEESLANPDVMPPIDDFLEIREAYLDVFSEVMKSNDLDALVFPQRAVPVPDFSSSEDRDFSLIGSPEINIMGTPGITVPAGNYADGSPFSLSFLGESFSEADLLSYAYDYEQGTI
jgi:Asp-tRNA(Asn)/Glu-tRNA(Gln) amidotransferase A subunit family amidase